MQALCQKILLQLVKAIVGQVSYPCVLGGNHDFYAQRRLSFAFDLDSAELLGV